MSSAKPPSRVGARRYKRVDDRWESLSAQIKEYAPLLVGQGDLVLKKIGVNRFWYLRFLLPPDEKGHRRHRSVYVGREADIELVARVRALLDDCRAPRRWVKELDVCVKLAAVLNRVVESSRRHHPAKGKS